MTAATNANVDESNLYECLFEDQDYSMFDQTGDNLSDEEELVEEGEESEDEDAQEEPSLPMPERELDDESSSEEDI